QDVRGVGFSRAMLGAMCDKARDLGFDSLVAPVRANGKHLVPEMSIAEYAALTREDGLPMDAWVRVHVRAGGTIVGVAARAMAVAGSLAAWREWTGLPFDASGPVAVPGALVPAMCDMSQNHAP